MLAEFLKPGAHNGNWEITVSVRYPFPPWNPQTDSQTIQRTVLDIYVRDVLAVPLEHGYVVMHDPDDPDLDSIRIQYTIDWHAPGLMANPVVRVRGRVYNLDPEEGTDPLTTHEDVVASPGTYTMEWTPSPALARGTYSFDLYAILRHEPYGTIADHDYRNSTRTVFGEPGAYIHGPVRDWGPPVRGAIGYPSYSWDGHSYGVTVCYKIRDDMSPPVLPSDVDVKGFGSKAPEGNLDRLAEQEDCPTYPVHGPGEPWDPEKEVEAPLVSIHLDGHVRPAGSYSELNQYQNEHY